MKIDINWHFIAIITALHLLWDVKGQNLMLIFDSEDSDRG